MVGSQLGFRAAKDANQSLRVCLFFSTSILVEHEKKRYINVS
jgi:hypothetical protein